MSQTAEADAEDDLPDITEQQQAFVKGILDGLTAADAYRKAYDCSAMKPESIWVAASRLRSNANVALWLSRARQAHLGSAIVTKDGHLRELERLREIALELKDPRGAIAAEVSRGKVAGLYVDRSEMIINNPAAILHEIAQIDADLAAQLAQRFAMPIALIEHQPVDTNSMIDQEQDDVIEGSG